MYNIGNCGNNWKLLYIEEIGNWKQFPVSFFKKNTWQILSRPRAPMLAGGVYNFWQLCHFLTGNFWKMSDYGNSHNLEDVRLWKKCQIMGISIIWKIVKYLSMTRVALLSIFPVFYIISNLCLYIKMYKYSLKNFKKSIDLLLIFMYNNICKVVETQKT